MKSFIWDQAQRHELEWWERWESKDNAVLGKGGTSRYPLYLKVFSEFFSSDSILDVGSGPYPLVNWIPCKRRVALDPLNSKFTEKGFSRNTSVEYLDSMAEDLPFKDNSFEQVLLLNMLDHLDDWCKAVDEALRVASQSVLVHVHIDGPFAGDGMHRILREDEIVYYLETTHNGVRIPFRYPPRQQSLLRRYGSWIKNRCLSKGSNSEISVEKCWAGVICKSPC